LLLSHYTNRAGLEGIAQSGSLWATNFLSLNDETEYFYAWKEIQSEALNYALERIPFDLLAIRPQVDEFAQQSITQLRTQLASTDGYGHLYVTSFAAAKSPHQEADGILTLWHRYTQLEGYCLQFEYSDLEHMLSLEEMRGSYSLLRLSPVTYGIDKNTLSFRELATQLGEQLLVMAKRHTEDDRIELKYQDHWAPSHLAAKLMYFCGTYKDPAFEDEREVRILAYPNDKAVAHMFTGIAGKKRILERPDGKKHLALWDNWKPGIEPKRIIIGPKADRDIETILAKFRRAPEVYASAIPIVYGR
jgi:hypothetical protein